MSGRRISRCGDGSSGHVGKGGDGGEKEQLVPGLHARADGKGDAVIVLASPLPVRQSLVSRFISLHRGPIGCPLCADWPSTVCSARL